MRPKTSSRSTEPTALVRSPDAGGRILWDRAHLVVTASDAGAVQNAAALEWGDETLEFLPGPGPAAEAGGAAGFHVPIAEAAKAETAFDFTLSLNGSGALRLTPFAKRTRVELTSNWPERSANYASLPLAPLDALLESRA